MSNLSKYQGVFPAFYACYDEQGNVSIERTRAFAEYLIEKGVNGLYVGGSSGECIYQDVQERMDVLEAVMEVAKGKVAVIAHVACNNTRDSQKLAAHAERVGVDAIASIPPIYFKLPEHAIAQYWNDISAAAPHTDFIIYNIPVLAGVALTRPLLREMRKNPRMIGVKNSSMVTMDIEQFKAEGGKDFVVFNGPDEQFVAGRVMGACGGIGGTYATMPELFLTMDQHIKAGEMDQAFAIQTDVNAIILTLCSAKGNMYAVNKAVIEKRTGLKLGSVRLPLAPLFEGDMAVVDKAAAMIDEAIHKYC